MKILRNALDKMQTTALRESRRFSKQKISAGNANIPRYDFAMSALTDTESNR